MPKLFAPINIAWLIYFRILFGAMLLIEAVHYLLQGWPRAHYDPAAFHFTYAGFHWVRPWPAPWGMNAHFVAIGALGLLVALGLFYRVAAALLFVAFTYVFLLEQTYYLNHFYLIALLAFLMIFLPAHRAGSLDARFRPSIRAETVPAWTLWLIRFQLGVVYVFGGIAKLNPDWLRGEPMRLWLYRRGDDWPRLAPILRHDWTPYLFSYGGILLDLLIVPALMWRRTRAIAIAASVAFHLTNAMIFDIGIFPWLMLGASIVFFEPGWVRRSRAMGGPPISAGSKEGSCRQVGAVLLRALHVILRYSGGPLVERASRTSGEWSFGVPQDDNRANRTTNHGRAAPVSKNRVVLTCLIVWVAIQFLLPFRHWLYPGPVNWTEEGHRFSWHMKLRDKQGSCTFLLTDPITGATESVDPSQSLTRRQARLTAVHPEFALQYARHLADERVRAGRARPIVRVRGVASLNGRKEQPLIDPSVDLGSIDAPALAHWPWILPLTEPLDSQTNGESRGVGAAVPSHVE